MVDPQAVPDEGVVERAVERHEESVARTGGGDVEVPCGRVDPAPHVGTDAVVVHRLVDEGAPLGVAEGAVDDQ